MKLISDDSARPLSLLPVRPDPTLVLAGAGGDVLDQVRVATRIGRAAARGPLGGIVRVATLLGDQPPVRCGLPVPFGLELGLLEGRIGHQHLRRILPHEPAQVDDEAAIGCDEPRSRGR